MSSLEKSWNRGVPLYTEVSSLEKSWNRGVPLYTEVSSLEGVGIEESEVSSFQVGGDFINDLITFLINEEESRSLPKEC